jgi:hypothetical protein
MDSEELAAELAAMKEELRETQRELDKANAAKEDIPADAAAFIAAVTKVDLPSFWDADPVLWFRHYTWYLNRMVLSALVAITAD